MHQITPSLWINDGRVEEAVEFYCSLFEDSRVTASSDYGPEAGEYAGQKMVVSFTLQGQPFTAINGAGTRFEANEAVSLGIPCEEQKEVDRLWDALVVGGHAGPCGWLKDRFGFSWQIYPTVLDDMLADPDPEKVQRVSACLRAVDGRAFDIEELRAAFDGR